MLRSMTGFGVGRAAAGEEEISVEVRSVNHKFCEVKVRLPRELSALETVISKTVKDRLARGAIDVSVKRQTVGASNAVPTVDAALAREYRRAFSEIARAANLADEARTRDIAQQQGVIRLEERGVDLAKAQEALARALDQAVAALTQMREVEGKAIEADLLARLGHIQAASGEVAKLAPKAVDEYRRRLEERLAEITRGVPVDPQRLAQEVAFMAERTDIAEELTRLASHLDQFRALIASPEPSGRKMDFLVQEMNREVNTTGSKSQHTEISQRVVAMKAEIERIREQVQNVE